MTCSLKSTFDKETYEDYLDGKRRYFTVNGMEIDSTAQEKTPIDFLKHKYRNHDDYPVTTELVKSYVDLYNMESGVIFSPDQLIISATKYVGCIAYIENDFVFMSYIVCFVSLPKQKIKKLMLRRRLNRKGCGVMKMSVLNQWEQIIMTLILRLNPFWLIIVYFRRELKQLPKTVT